MNVQEFNKWLVTCVTSNPVRHKFSSCWSPHLLIIIGSFSNNCGDGSENVKKAKGLISKTTTLHMQQTFCTFLCCHCTTTVWKSLISHVMKDVNKWQQIFLSLSKLECGLQEINSREIHLHLTFSGNWN